MSRYAIFGGAGFVGGHLARGLVDQGHDVTVFDLRAPEMTGVTFVRTDVRHPLAPMPDAFDVAVNLAAVHRTPGHAQSEYYDTNVKGAIHVTEWLETSRVRTCVFTSSISVYGPREELLDEQAPLRPNSAYGHSKELAEQIHTRWVDAAAQRRLIVCRPAVIFGSGEGGNFTRLAKALARGSFAFPGRTDTVKACGYVKDLVRSIRFALNESAERRLVYNFAYPQQLTISQIVGAFASVAGYKPPRTVPDAAVRVGMAAARFGAGDTAQRIGKLRASTHIAPRVLQDAGFRWEFSLEEALQDWYSESGGKFQ